MKKNRITTICFREISQSFKRFISLFVMSLLGVGVFVGIKMASPDLLKTLDSFYDANNTYDIKIISTLGLTDNDIFELTKLNSKVKVYGTYSKDVIIENNNNEKVIKVHGVTKEINNLIVTSGRLPNNNNEVVVEDYLLEIEQLKIGDSININDDDKTFKEDKLVIVGTVRSPLYINSAGTMGRGNTTLGTGTIDYYVYVNENNFDLDYYTELYISVNGSKEKVTNSKEYNKVIDKCLDDINKIKNEREESRYQEVYNEARKEIDKDEKKYLKEFDSAKEKLDDANVQLLSAKKILGDTKIKLDNANDELEINKSKLEDAKKQIDNAKNEINEELKKYNISIEDINNVVNKILEIEISKEEIKDLVPTDTTQYDEIILALDKVFSIDIKGNLVDIINGSITTDKIIDQIPNDIENYDEIVSAIRKLEDSDFEKKVKEFITSEENIDKIIDKVPTDIENYDEIIKFLDFYKNNSSDLLKLIESIQMINLAENEYEEGYLIYTKYYNEYQEGLTKYTDGLKTYNNNFNFYSTQIEEYYRSRKIFEYEIMDAREKLKEIPEAQWFVYDRLDDFGYAGFIENCNSVANLAKLFPSIFFIVAVLISLISMSRMVEEDRMQIGTLKSLGFSNIDIRKKYLLYSGSATIFGGLVGAFLGFFLLPRYVYEMYKIMHDIPYFKYDFNPNNTIIGIVIAVLCICGTTLLTIRKVVREKPSDLMRPKAPEMGKRILLERIRFIWDRIKFSNKITIRNLFRYKKRVLMTIGGILGCTGIMLVGFGICDSIVGIPDKQFKEIFHFNEMVYLTDNTTNEVLNDIFSNEIVKNRADTHMSSIMIDIYSTNLFVPNEESELQNILELRDLKTGKKLKLVDNQVIISDKLAEFTNKKVGDKITLKISDVEQYEFIISAICENYVGHYIFMNKETYENNIDKYQTNVVYLNLFDLNKEKELSKEILKHKNVMTVISRDATTKNINDSLSTLNSVVLILIFLSGSLSFVVLYNLSNINISERKREIATLKVLGFTDKEVDNYITKETLILTMVGILFGLVFGSILTFIIVDTVEVENVRFMHNITLSSYIITSFLIMLFTIIVNKIIHYSLKKIDMIESLKSVE